MCLELRDCYKRFFWNLPPYRKPDLFIAGGGRGRIGPVSSILRRRGALVSGGVEERFFVHGYEMANRGTNVHFINQEVTML